MASEGGSEFNDPRRVQLIQNLKSIAGIDSVGGTVWACLWLADLERLEWWVEKCDPLSTPAVFQFVEILSKMVPKWITRCRPSSSISTPKQSSSPHRSISLPSTSLPSIPLPLTSLSSTSKQLKSPRKRRRNQTSEASSPGRSRPARDQCLDRDQRKCVITGADEPVEVAHIFPFSMRFDDASAPNPNFWHTLRMFWSEDRVNSWYNAISTEARTEICSNLICMAPNSHQYWGKCFFALKPIAISEDKKRLDIQFFWLPRNSWAANSQIDLLQRPSIPYSDRGGSRRCKLFNVENDQKIWSAYEFSMTTDDPDTRPLPDFRLLEMQWFLHRVAAMSGAAEPRDDFGDGDDDNDDMMPWPCMGDWYRNEYWDWEEPEELAEVPDADMDRDVDNSGNLMDISNSSSQPQHLPKANVVKENPTREDVTKENVTREDVAMEIRTKENVMKENVSSCR